MHDEQFFEWDDNWEQMSEGEEKHYENKKIIFYNANDISENLSNQENISESNEL